MKQAIAIALGWLMVAIASAEELVIRNVGLVRAGHLINIVGTVYNTADHAVESTHMIVNVVDRGRVIASEVVKIPDLESGQAWRLAQPLRETFQAVVAQTNPETPNVSSITIDTKKFPRIFVKRSKALTVDDKLGP